MIRFIYIYVIVITGCLNSSLAQQNETVDSLHRLFSTAVSDSDKVVTLNNLANYYYSNKQVKQGDSVINEQLRIAELSNNNNLILKTYFDNSIAAISTWSSTGEFNRTIQFIQKGINFAKSINSYDHIVIGYTRLASVLRKKGEGTGAVENAYHALNYLQNLQSDSLKAVIYIELGDSYQSREESLSASNSYTNAFDIAIKSKNHFLESNIYHRLSQLYSKLGDETEAKNLLIKSVTINRKYHNGEGLIKDYLELAKLTDDPFYVHKVLALSDSLGMEKYRLGAKTILLAIYTVKLKDSKKALEYLNSEPELKAVYMQGGIENYYFELGEIYRYADKPDSALLYFKMAEPELVKNYDLNRYLYSEMAVCYEMKKDRDNAILYYEKSFPHYKQAGELSAMATVSSALSILYKENSEFEKALINKELTANLKDTLSKLAKDKDLALSNVDRERRKHEEEILQESLALQDKHNLQYMLITISICIIFIGMLVIGMFPISKVAIKIFGYFFFISLFEFIVLFLDNTVLHSVTHGEPLKLWLIKIGLIGLLVPIQHFLEHKLTVFLASRRLLKARKNFSVKKWWPKKTMAPHNPPKSGIEKMEEGTAVL